MKANGTKFICPVCGQHFATSARYIEHVLLHGAQDFAIALMATVLLILLTALPMKASTPVLTRLADEVIDTNGQPVVNSVFYLDCDGEQLTVSIEVTFTDGAKALLTSDNYCGAKIYVEGYVSLAEVVAVASGPSAVYQSFLPMLSR